MRTSFGGYQNPISRGELKNSPSPKCQFCGQRINTNSRNKFLYAECGGVTRWVHKDCEKPMEQA